MYDSCVNALSWSSDGHTLVSSGDDTRLLLSDVAVFRKVSSNLPESVYGVWVVQRGTHVIQGSIQGVLENFRVRQVNIYLVGANRASHTANVFSAQYLPCSSMIATAAGDRQVRVFDVTRTGALDVQDACIKVLKCHKSR